MNPDSILSPDSLSVNESNDNSVAFTSPAASPKSSLGMSAREFFELSKDTSPILVGAATANFESRRSLLFFPNPAAIATDNPTSIPVDRVESIELLDEKPLENAPLTLPSVWHVRIELKPTVARKGLLDSTFEAD